MTVAYGVTGTGWIATEVATALAALPGARVAATCPHPFPGARTTESVDELLDVGVDAVVVCGHAPRALLAAVRAGVHAFHEQPLAASWAECRPILQTAASSQAILMAGNVLQFADGVAGARATVRGGAIGDLVYARAVRTGPEHARAHEEGDPGFRRTHELDLILALMGDPSRVTLAGTDAAPWSGDVLLATLEFPGERYATLQLGAGVRWPEHHLVLAGSEGAVRVELQHAGTAESGDPRSLWLRGLLAEEMAHFHGLITGAPPDPELAVLTDLAAMARAVRVADALALSLAEDRKVSLESAGPVPEEVLLGGPDE